MTRRSEFALISAFRDRLPAPHPGVIVGSGDDCAVVRAAGATSVVSIDTTVDGVHARLDLGDDPLRAARDFGWRALTTALSDLAACGVGQPEAGSAEHPSVANPGQLGDGDSSAAGTRSRDASFVWALPADEPSLPGIEAYVAVTLPPDLDDARVLAVADGMAEAAEAFGASVIGGDVTSGPVLVVSTTVVGWLDDPPLRRRGARPGDLVGLTGPIGAAGAGLALTLGQATAAELDEDTIADLREAYLRPFPHLHAGADLRAAGATAAIDLSDGLLADAAHLARASGVTLVLDPDAIPIAEGVAEIAAEVGIDPLLFAQSAGEDFVLLVTVPRERRAKAQGAGIWAWIGEVERGEPVVTGLPVDPSGRTGHDHRG